MQEIIERLKKEKKEYDDSWYQAGKSEGLDFGKHANYAELQDVLAYSKIGDFDINGNQFPTSHDDFGEYFSNILENEDNRALHNGAVWEVWEQGWCDGVGIFWNEVKDEL